MSKTLSLLQVHISENVKTTSQEVSESHGNNTDKNNTDPFPSFSVNEEKDEFDAVYDFFSERLQIGYLKNQHRDESDRIDEILDLIVDACQTKETYIRIGGGKKPASIVRSRFMKLGYEHIEFVLSCMNENTTRIRNIRQYLLTVLYNAPVTISNYYSALVSHKHDLTKHPEYKNTGDCDKALLFDIEKYLSTEAELRPDDEFIVINAEEEDE